MHTQEQSPLCWCGNTQLEPYSDAYALCRECYTLVAISGRQGAGASASTTDEGFYGKQYWLEHQRETLGQSDIAGRSVADLSERCPYWLDTLLEFRLPPARFIDLGCGHGGFVALAQAAGFSASGTEMSSFAATFAREHFGVDVLVGTAQDVEADPGSIDVLTLMDVIEHVDDPAGVLSRCRQLAGTDGLLMLQTPCFPETATYDELVARDDPFLRMMIPDEHLFLYSKTSIKQLLAEAGFIHHVFRPARFAYDMFVFASRSSLGATDTTARNAVFVGGPEKAAVGALVAACRERDEVVVRDRECQLRLIESEADRNARHDQILELTDLARTAQIRVEALQAQITELVHALKKMGLEPVFSMLAYMGRLPNTQSLFRSSSKKETAEEPEETCTKSRHVVVDLTPVLPGGANGGAKLMTLELIRNLAQLTPEWTYTLLTNDKSHDELAWLDCENITRRLTVESTAPDAENTKPHAPTRLQILKGKVRGRLVWGAEKTLPHSVLYRLKAHVHDRLNRDSSLVHSLKADLLFNPFTAPFYHDPRIPTVGVIYDLQYLYYPAFFSDEDRYQRGLHFKNAAEKSDRLVCISEYVRQTVLDNTALVPDQVETVHITMANRLPQVDKASQTEILGSLGLTAGSYFLYPANFWQHKNHKMLLTAFGMFQARHPDNAVKLVLTGAPGHEKPVIEDAVRAMKLFDMVVFPGYLDEKAFEALFANAMALIFPSLYEGFGMPVLEAFLHDVPVACSNVTSLPEVAGDAALFFDPKRPETMVTALEELAGSGLDDAEARDRREALVAKGRKRLTDFGGPEEMAKGYLAVFKDVLESTRCYENGLFGVDRDDSGEGSWTRSSFTVTAAPAEGTRLLELDVIAPPELPHKKVTVSLSGKNISSSSITLKRGERGLLTTPVKEEGGLVEITVSPSFSPKRAGLSDDPRLLGVKCLAARLRGEEETVELI